MKNDGGPAFPGVCGQEGYGHLTRCVDANGECSYVDHNQGLSLLDYFAIHCNVDDLAPATRELCASRIGVSLNEYSADPTGCYMRLEARLRYDFAEAMLAERERRAQS